MEANSVNPYAAPNSDTGNVDQGYGTVKMFSVSGRLGRVRYLGYLMAVMLVLWLGGSVVIGIGTTLAASVSKDAGKAFAIVSVTALYGASIVMSIMLAIQRIHDFNMSGWMVLLMLVPFVNIIFGLALWFIPGTDGSNRYGAKTPPNGTGVTVLAALTPLFIVAYIGVIAAIAIPAYQKYEQRARLESSMQHR